MISSVNWYHSAHFRRIYFLTVLFPINTLYRKSHKILAIENLTAFILIISRSQNHNYFNCNTCTKNLWVIFGLFPIYICLPSIDFTGFLRSSSKSAVANKKYFYIIYFNPKLPHFARSIELFVCFCLFIPQYTL